MCMSPKMPKIPDPPPPPPPVPPPERRADDVSTPGSAQATREGRKMRKRRQGTSSMRTAGLQINY